MWYEPGPGPGGPFSESLSLPVGARDILPNAAVGESTPVPADLGLALPLAGCSRADLGGGGKESDGGRKSAGLGLSMEAPAAHEREAAVEGTSRCLPPTGLWGEHGDVMAGDDGDLMEGDGGLPGEGGSFFGERGDGGAAGTESCARSSRDKCESAVGCKDAR